VVARIGFRLHDGQLHSHTSGRRHHHDFGTADPGKKSLARWREPNFKTLKMNTHKTHKHESGEHLVEDAQALLTATAHVAEEKVVEARKRLMAAIEKGKETWNDVQEKAIAGAKATDQVIRDNPYKALGIALGVGAIIGYLLRRRD
jgi:ElaB/YqjD/DUF883 family membrane-anchored ribosome-binding protein